MPLLLQKEFFFHFIRWCYFFDSATFRATKVQIGIRVLWEQCVLKNGQIKKTPLYEVKNFFRSKSGFFFYFGTFYKRPYYWVDHPIANLDLFGMKSDQIKKITPLYEVKKKIYEVKVV